MDEIRSIISYRADEYGSVKVKLAELLDSRGITRNRLKIKRRFILIFSYLKTKGGSYGPDY